MTRVVHINEKTDTKASTNALEIAGVALFGVNTNHSAADRALPFLFFRF